MDATLERLGWAADPETLALAAEVTPTEALAAALAGGATLLAAVTQRRCGSRAGRVDVDGQAHLLNMGAYIDPNAGRETVAAYSARWAPGQPWRPSSRHRVEHVLRAQIVPVFGSLELRQVRPSDVQAWIGSMASAGLAASTVESYFRVLAAVMRAARRDRLIHESPCDGARLPRSDRSRSALVPLTTEQVHELAATVPARYSALVIASAGLALRQGEACGLTVDRVDFLRRRVTIDRQLISPPRGAVHFGPTKTAFSHRVLTLPDTVGHALSVHLRRFGQGCDGLIFISSSGAPLRRSTWSDAFRSASRTLGLDVSTHGLRHYGVSLLISAGCSVTAVQHFLGHKNASETLDTYSHLWPSDDDRIRLAIDAGLGDVHEVCTTDASEG